MQSVNECYKKVKKDCFKFIKSQETPKEKFKNIERMVKSFLIPISIWIAGKTNKKKPYIVGLGGGTGSRQNNNQFNYYNYFKKIF